MEEAAAKPQEDGLWGRSPLFLGKVSSSLLVFAHDTKPLVVGTQTCRLFTTVQLGTLPEKLSLVFAYGMLVKMALGCTLVVEKALAGHCLLAMALVHPHFVHGPLPVPVGGLLVCTTSSKN
jgi:hypothetical protein